MKVSELEGAQLDYWVASAEGIEVAKKVDGKYYSTATFNKYVDPYSPSIDWSQGGPIIERERIAVADQSNGIDEPEWVASKNGPVHINSSYNYLMGNTALIAAMRCFVASKYGDTVDDSQTH